MASSTRCRLGYVCMLLVVSIMVAGVVEAQSARTAVSLTGDDANNCTVVAPCRSFGRAISQTSAGGEVVVLSSAGYGPFTVDKSVSIVAPPGVYAGVTALSGTAIAVNAATTDKIQFRGLTVTAAAATYGLQIYVAGVVHVEACYFSGNGIGVQSGGQYFINDTTVRNAGYGLTLFGETSRLAEASVNRCRFENNSVGIFASNDSRLTIVDSVASGGNKGIVLYPNSGSIQAHVERCVLSGNNVSGVESGNGGGTGTVRVSNSVITGSSYGLYAGNGGTVLSRSNNTIRGNTADMFLGGGIISTYAAN